MHFATEQVSFWSNYYIYMLICGRRVAAWVRRKHPIQMDDETEDRYWHNTNIKSFSFDEEDKVILFIVFLSLFTPKSVYDWFEWVCLYLGRMWTD